MVAGRVRSGLLRSVSALSLATAAAIAAPGGVQAQSLGGPASTYLSLEGGAACPFGDTVDFLGEDLLNEGCGWTGRVGFGQESAAGGLFDNWGLFVRHTRFPENTATYSAPPYSGIASTDEMRTVVDFEVGQDIGIGGGEARLMAGLRYADHRGGFGIYVGNGAPLYTLDFDVTAWGVGPRVGVATRTPFGGNFGLALGGAVAALYGQTTVSATGTFGPISSSVSETEMNWMLNAEGEAGLYWQPGASASELVLGVRGEWWRDTADVPAPNRHNWGPFLRYKMSLGGS